MSREQTKMTLWLLTLGAVLAWSAVGPHDYFTWFLEVVPVFLGVGILAATYRRFRFTDLVYGLIWIHAVILIIGGHYTYAQMPLFNWIRDAFHLTRNYYDRVGHFAQGFVPALIAREFLLRKSPLKRGKLTAFLVVSVCLALGALSELFVWRVAGWPQRPRPRWSANGMNRRSCPPSRLASSSIRVFSDVPLPNSTSVSAPAAATTAGELSTVPFAPRIGALAGQALVSTNRSPVFSCG